MRTTRFYFLIFVFIFVCATIFSRNIAQATKIPYLAAPSAYTGEYNQEEHYYKIFLYLGNSYHFWLREEARLKNGKISIWETTGRWHQIRNRSVLQLINRNGFHRFINVGAKGDLYTGIQTYAVNHISIILQRYDDEIPIFSLSGLLHVKDTGLWFDDYVSGIRHKIIPNNLVNTHIKKYIFKEALSLPVCIQACVVHKKDVFSALRINDIQSIQTKENFEILHTTDVFLDAVTQARWRVTCLPTDPIDEVPQGAYIAFFPGKNRSEGAIDIFDGVQHITGSYSLSDDSLTLSAVGGDARFATFINQTRSWRLTGEVLELWGEEHILALLEKNF